MAVFKINLDIDKATVIPEEVRGRVGDAESLIIEASIFQSAQPFDITEEGMTARFECDKPNGAVVRDDDVTVEGNKITYLVPATVLGVNGEINTAFFRLMKDGTYYDSTESFTITVLPGSDGAIPEGYVSELEVIISNLKTQERARIDAELQRVSNENERVQHETERVEAEDDRLNKEAERQAAEAIRIAKENERIEAEKLRKSGEDGRVSAEIIRVANEEKRVENEDERVIAEAKRKADFAAMMGSSSGATVRILGEDEYDETGHPTGEGSEGVIYFVPAQTVTPDANNEYVEWMYISNHWDIIGSTAVKLNPITTDQYDAVVASESPSGDEVVDLTGLSYFWAKLKKYFAEKIHKHDAADITSGEFGTDMIADGAITKAKIDPELTSTWDSQSQLLWTGNLSVGSSIEIKGIERMRIIGIRFAGDDSIYPVIIYNGLGRIRCGGLWKNGTATEARMYQSLIQVANNTLTLAESEYMHWTNVSLGNPPLLASGDYNRIDAVFKIL